MVNIEELFKELDIEKINVLKEQIQRFNDLKNLGRKVTQIDEQIILPEGTLIHGTPCYLRNLESISKTGILTGQSIGKDEDGETYYCADFHRVSETQTLNRYNKEFPYIDGRCPFGKKGKSTLAFIIYPDERLKELVSYDCYRDNTLESNITKSFINYMPIDDIEKGASILFGIPSNFINGIVLGDKYISLEVVNFLLKQFPKVFITRNNGELIYKNGDTIEMVNLRIKSIQRQIELEETKSNLEIEKCKSERLDNNLNELWKAVSKLPVESIVKIYEGLHYQDPDSYSRLAENLKGRYTEESKTM